MKAWDSVCIMRSSLRMTAAGATVPIMWDTYWPGSSIFAPTHTPILWPSPVIHFCQVRQVRSPMG